jgi:hypothetical protein
MGFLLFLGILVVSIALSIGTLAAIAFIVFVSSDEPLFGSVFFIAIVAFWIISIYRMIG